MDVKLRLYFHVFVIVLTNLFFVNNGLCADSSSNSETTLVWLDYDSKTNLKTLKLRLEQEGAKIITLAPEGKLLIRIPTAKLPEESNDDLNIETGSSFIKSLLNLISSSAPKKGKKKSAFEAIEGVRSLRKRKRVKALGEEPTVKPGRGALPINKKMREEINKKYKRIRKVKVNELAAQRVLFAGASDSSGNMNSETIPSEQSESASTLAGGFTSLPSSVDNSASKYFPPINNQGNMNSCTAFAVGYYFNTYTQAKDHDIEVGNKGINICSPAFLYPLTNYGEDNGAYTHGVMNLLNSIGCANWNIMPYDHDGDHTIWPSEVAWKEALAWRTKDFWFLEKYEAVYSDEDIHNIKQLLANGELIVTHTRVFNNWGDPGSYKKLIEGSIDNWVVYAEDGNEPESYHAMTIVGYDDNREYYNNGTLKQGAFLIANSWGSLWGTTNTSGGDEQAKGFMWVSYELFKANNMSFYFVFHNTDREDYKPLLYASAGINHPSRAYVELSAGVGETDSPDWLSYSPTYSETPISVSEAVSIHGGYDIEVEKEKPIVIDITEAIEHHPIDGPMTFFIKLINASSRLDKPSSATGNIQTAKIYYDPDRDGENLIYYESSDPIVTVTEGTIGYAEFNIDLLAPTVSISSPGTNSEINAPITINITFSESVDGFTLSDIEVSNASKSNFSENGNLYSFTLLPSADGVVTVSIPKDVATDDYSNGNIASEVFRKTYNTPPFVSDISSQEPSPSRLGEILVSVRFSENISGFELRDINTVNSYVKSTSLTTINAALYSFILVPEAEGLISATIITNSFQDSVGATNLNPSSTFKLEYDITAPEVSFSLE